MVEARVRRRLVLRPQPEAAERISSQRWHRDYNDKHLLKVFLYLVDVDETMGPFQFVAGSQPGGPYDDAWGWQPLGQNYPTEKELESRIPASAVQTFTGPAGTLLFCNTAGFHRGGSRRRSRASSRPRRTRRPRRSRP